MRRTWYSMYVLDRLLALQLGRPAAIHEDDYLVNLPSKAGESVSGEDQQGTQPADNEPSSIDYFLSVIKFSGILGQVISDLDSPSQANVPADQMLLRTTALDSKLADWKLSLPRHLRFDLGHTFEKSVVFRRQVSSLPALLRCKLIHNVAKYACYQVSSSTCSDSSAIPLPCVVPTARRTPGRPPTASPKLCRGIPANLRTRSAECGSSLA